MSDNDYRRKIEEVSGDRMGFEVYEFIRPSHGPIILGASEAGVKGNASTGTVLTLHHSISAPMVWRQVRILLNGGSAMLEPGALQYALGKMQIAVQKHEQKSNIFSRAMASAGSGESGFATRYEGFGEVWTEPTTKYFIAASMDGPADALLLDDRAFYACEGTVAVKTHIHTSVQGLFAGNGFMQPKLEGRGAILVESPVPANEIEEISLDGSQELIVDGDLMLMYSASLTVELKPLVRGLRNLYRSGEGLVYRIRGTGTVWLTPTARIGH